MANILISAYDCAPGKGSEEEIGWSIIHEVAKRHMVWVLTRSKNKLLHENEYKSYSKPAALNFIYYDLPRWIYSLIKGKNISLVYYYLWQLGSYVAAKEVIKIQKIEIVHHLTKCMDWMPSGIALLGKPFIWGSVGSEDTHPFIKRTFTLKVWISEIMREILRFYGKHIDIFVKLTIKKAKIILTHTPESVSAKYRNKIVSFNQTGIHLNSRYACPKKEITRGNVFRVLFAGELVHWKGAILALTAFQEFSKDKNDTRFILIGNGPLYGSLSKIAIRNGLNSKVEFHGHVCMNRLIDELNKSDVFLFPSYHHGLATVVLQAMLTGLPIICIDGDAHGRTIGSECGITVTMDKKSDVSHLLADALENLYLDESLRVEKARRAKEMAREYSYDKLGKCYEEVYKRVIYDIKCKSDY